MPTLAAYAFTAMTAWQSTCATNQVEYCTSIADDVAAVVTRPDEPALFKDDPYRAKTALVLLSIANWETSGYLKRIDEGNCKKWECDRGAAFTLWQIQPSTGLVFDGTSWDYAFRRTKEWRDANPNEVFTGPDLVKDRKLAIRMALHMARQSIRSTGSLCIYTGERDSTTGRCRDKTPKADLRLKSAIRYFAAHPFEPDAT